MKNSFNTAFAAIHSSNVELTKKLPARKLKIRHIVALVVVASLVVMLFAAFMTTRSSYTASYFAEQFPERDNNSPYETVVLNSLPEASNRKEEAFLPLYEKDSIPTPLESEEAFRRRAVRFFEKIIYELGTDKEFVPEREEYGAPIITEKHYSYSKEGNIQTAELNIVNGYSVIYTQDEYFNTVVMKRIIGGKFIFRGMKLEVNQHDSSEDIFDLNVISAVEHSVDYGIGDFSVSVRKVDRHYSENDSNGVDKLEVLYYDGYNRYDKWLENSYICISFDNSREQSSSILSDVTVTGKAARRDYEELIEETDSQVTMKLVEAEALLKEGCVFGAHYCEKCKEEGKENIFAAYDYYTIVYHSPETQPNTEFYDVPVLPFYKFYKKVGTTENGRGIYAVAYLPAIRVNDIDEYMQSCAQAHK